MDRWNLFGKSALAVGLALGIGAFPKGASAAAPAKVDFAKDVYPLLRNACFDCHGAEKQEGDLRLDLREAFLTGGASGKTVEPFKPDDSELLRRVMLPAGDTELMPARGVALKPQEVAVLRNWISQGATWPEDLKLETHWAFVAPQAVEPPAVKNEGWVRNPIDRFVLAQLEKDGWAPASEADRGALIRRAALDLTGVPPTLEEIDQFEADASPDAYEKLIDRLLASPRFGERMAWDWLDAARYADTNGYQGDPERTMWPWRDWVVQALNDNMPFDQFTVEQLAGDLLPNRTDRQVLATGFNRCHMFNGEGGRIAEETRVENVVDRVDATTTVWLGMTVACARCHDHKYDPISQREYYQLYAFFNNTSETGGGSGRGRSGQIPPTLDVISDADRGRRTTLDQAVDSAAKSVAEQEEALQKTSPDAVKPPDAIAAEWKKPPAQRTTASLSDGAKHFKAEHGDYAQALTALRKGLDERQKFESGVPRVMVMDDLAKPRESFILVKGAYDKHGERVSADTPKVFYKWTSAEKKQVERPMNRLELAQWLVSGEHPLTARVTVNRAWQTIFGLGLVKTTEDFGLQGERPSHPALLDWLAVEFVRQGWDVKKLYRLLATSAVYRQSSQAPAEQWEQDPENRRLARGARRRMPSWMIRDQALAASGLLVEKLGGPAVKSYQPPGVWEEATFGKIRYAQDHGPALYRRSLYLFWRRIVGPTQFFDAANRQTCSVRNIRTNTPLHALALLNDPAYVEAARALAQVSLRQATDDDGRLTFAFRRATSRRPTPAELDVLRTAVARLRKQFEADPEAAGKLLAVGESARDAELPVVEHAAWASLCLTLLNLDEALSRP